MSVLSVGVLLDLILAAHLSAQWLHMPIPKGSQTPDGKPDLTAPTPKLAEGHPDLSGIWMPDTRTLQDLATGMSPAAVPYRPWAEKVFQERANGAKGKEDPAANCIPGMPKLIVLPYPYKIFQLPGVTVVLYEGFTTFRQIFTDGRMLPEDPQASWMGYSVGQWDGDTFVVKTIGINESTWMDNAGRPHSDALRTIERYRRRNFGSMDVSITFDDPKAYTKPWTVNQGTARLLLGQDLLEYVCTENNKDIDHLFGSSK